MDAYLAVPAAGKARNGKAVLYISDVNGVWQNSKLLADQYAANGYLCLIPDLFDGDKYALNLPLNNTVLDWVARGTNGKSPHTLKEVEPKVVESIKYLQSEHGITKIGAVGYCFGAKYVVRNMKGPGSIDAGFVAHPSFVEEQEVENMVGPFSIAAAETDSIFPEERRYKTEEILKKKGQIYNISLYSGVSHGFAARGDMSKPVERWAKEEAFFQAVRFFDAWL